MSHISIFEMKHSLGSKLNEKCSVGLIKSVHEGKWRSATSVMPTSICLIGTQFSTQKSAWINDPEWPEKNIITLKVKASSHCSTKQFTILIINSLHFLTHISYSVLCQQSYIFSTGSIENEEKYSVLSYIETFIWIFLSLKVEVNVLTIFPLYSSSIQGYQLNISGIRLAGSTGPSQGRVEIEVNNTWGTICDSNFGRDEAMVICKMLGLKWVIKTQIWMLMYGSTLVI
jgi:hypothetical protein